VEGDHEADSEWDDDKVIRAVVKYSNQRITNYVYLHVGLID